MSQEVRLRVIKEGVGIFERHFGQVQGLKFRYYTNIANSFLEDFALMKRINYPSRQGYSKTKSSFLYKNLLLKILLHSELVR